MGLIKLHDVLHLQQIDLNVLGLSELQHLANKALLYLCNTDVSEL